MHIPRQQFLSNPIRMIWIKKLEINIRYRPLLSVHKWILTNGSDTVARVPFSMKLDNRRESSGGEQRQDGSLDSYPAPSSFASGEEKKKGGESDRRWHGNAIAMSDRSCQTMLSFPVSVQIRRSRNFSTRSIVTVAMNIQRNCGRNKERWEEKAERKRYNYRWRIDPFQFPYFDRFEEKISFTSESPIARPSHPLFMQYRTVIILSSARFNSRKISFIAAARCIMRSTRGACGGQRSLIGLE